MSQESSSPTYSMTLDEVIEQLSMCQAVEGILLIGSAACGEMGPASDYDLAVVLGEMPHELYNGLTYIDGHLADIFFVAADDVDRLLHSTEPVAAESWQGFLARWLTGGWIAFDRSGRLEQARQAVVACERLRPAGQADAYAAWYKINYNLRHNRRMLGSGDPVYMMALDFRLLYSLSDVLLHYFTLRGLMWEGEKDAIRYWSAYDPQYLALFQAYTAENSRERKLHLYEQMATLTTEPMGGLWPLGTSMFQPRPESKTPAEDANQALVFWNDLFRRLE